MLRFNALASLVVAVSLLSPAYAAPSSALQQAEADDSQGWSWTTLFSQRVSSSELFKSPNTGFTRTQQSSAIVPLISAANAEVIPDEYIVVVKEHLWDQHIMRLGAIMVASLANADDINIKPFHLPGMGGYSGKFGPGMVNALRASEEVDYIEQDQVVRINNAARLEHDAPWGLARISHKHWPRNESSLYHYYKDDGANVTAYVVDTGVNIDHVDFEGRARWGKTIPVGDVDIDGNGHGTHVAGTIAGATYGVAKQADIVAVKVLRSSGSGTMADVVRGIEWTYLDHKTRTDTAQALTQKDGKKRRVKSVGNMSLGGGFSRALNQAVDAAVLGGVFFAVAAGNENQNACHVSPAASKNAVTVGASTVTDSRAWFSNWGPCTDIFAPGHQILSAWIGSNVSTNTISGTSMASPHVAGLMAALISRPEYHDLDGKSLKKLLRKTATKKVLTGLPRGISTPNLLIYTQPPKTNHSVSPFI